ncbi:glycoside hydrolase N-terminal domain-containing protein [Niabella hibiscisoli]|uniref:glycoside hydrolase N-terminal domain-containing protein n=1 Tax=Niabella hibiscisoli TaxID=1825928 RepID=UPI001F0F6EDC|nr:glycoside hydrolase N-terminal domain-containing protein [Niabella hibiscisoli]MCH5720309.1 glycoside hydrolase N-terminal domain-containing protein [Niabella hibiscisoli]
MPAKISFLKFLVCLALVMDAGTINAQDLKLWYDKPATKWVEALPIGNGRIGAMVFGGVKNDRIQFNEETLWTGYPRNYNKQGAYKYLDTIRGLLFAGKQKQAEELAGKEFMGLKSNEGNRDAWLKKILSILQLKNNPSQPGYNDASWKTMAVPHYEGWETQGFEGMDGAVWFRYQFDLPAKWIGKDLKLDINKVADQDYTYINGTLIGSQANADARNYVIPASALKTGKNTISILVINFTSKGGIMGYKDVSNHIGVYPVNENAQQKLSLNGQWKYFIQDIDVPAVGQYQAAYQPFGDLNFVFDIEESAVKDYKRELDISRAVATTSYSYNGIQYQRSYISSAVDQALGVHFTSNKKEHQLYSRVEQSS